MGRALRLLRRLPGGRALFPVYGSALASTQVAHGDAARARKDWPTAAAAYRAAVEDQPGLAAIWVQLGHALKEQGALDGAYEAYGRAAALLRDDAETQVYMGHLAKHMGKPDASIGHLLRAHHIGGIALQESNELLWLMANRSGGRSKLVRLLKREIEDLPPRKSEAPFLTQLRAILTEDMGATEQRASARPTLVFDISDLISYFANARLPTGIQRVQIETIEGALQRHGDHDIRLCCFIDGRDEWLELPLEQMRLISRLSTAGGDRSDPAWVAALARLKLFLSLTHAFEFPQGATLINLGTSWWLQNYFLFVRHAKATKGIRYIPFVHDMIPIMAPEHCVRGLTQDFISWVIGVFDHADHFLVNSDATMRDLITVAATLGHDIDPADVAVIPLDADFRKPEARLLGDDALDIWSLKPGRFVLFVSTIESRKGHLVAFDAWADLIARHGADVVPQLVCVGNRGWLNDKIYTRLAEDPVLGAKVTMLSKLSDEELALLYRSCAFTLYPSLYEGWGLPVTESLCYGKVPLTSDAASLPQAGGAFAVFAAAGSASALAEAAERLILDTDYRGELEARIAADFRPRTWSDLASQIGDELVRFSARDEGHPQTLVAPQALTGAWHALTRNEMTRIWRGLKTAEIFRSNLGWFPPEARGCRIHRDGGELQMGVAGPHGTLRMFFQLIGDDHAHAQWVIKCGDVTLDGDLAPNQERWIACEVPPADVDSQLTISFSGYPAEDGAIITYFVRGFFLCEADDTQARLSFVEAVALNRLETLSAFRES